jgi:hypothetical protein
MCLVNSLSPTKVPGYIRTHVVEAAAYGPLRQSVSLITALAAAVATATAETAAVTVSGGSGQQLLQRVCWQLHGVLLVVSSAVGGGHGIGESGLPAELVVRRVRQSPGFVLLDKTECHSVVSV